MDADWIRYLPILTTLIAAVFCGMIVQRFRVNRSGPHLIWWATGVATYGLGTLLESIITVSGNTVLLNKAWYVMGALLGVYPLGQGTVYLLLSRKMANRLTLVTLPFVMVLAVLVILSPVNWEGLQPEKPSGDVLAWTWLRRMTPLINVYAAAFLIGGAAVSSWRYFRSGAFKNRAVGNALIAFGAILPGIGGVSAKMGYVEILYLTELVGLLIIWGGYAVCIRRDIASPLAIPENS